MNEQRCGTCRHYELDTSADKAGDYGWCTRRNKRDVPFHLEGGYWEVYAADGQHCRCWQAKETQDE